MDKPIFKGDRVKVEYGEISRDKKICYGTVKKYQRRDYNNGHIELEEGDTFTSFLGQGSWLIVNKID